MYIRTLCLIVLLGASIVSAQSTNVDSIRKAAEHGDPIAQFNLGTAYETGDGVQKDHEQAIAWYQKAADQGNRYAQTMIGYSYEIGYGVPQDFGQAASWFKKAAEQGEAAAQALLGYSYGAGKGLPQDYQQALSWYRKAADQGDSLGQAFLGSAYFEGQGVTKDYVEAYFWLNLALAGDFDGWDNFAGIRESTEKLRKEAAGHLTAEQLADTQQRATRWYEERVHRP